MPEYSSPLGMPINTGVFGRKVKSEEYFDDSFVYFLNSLWLRLPDDASHQDRHQGCANPEIIDVGKVVSFYIFPMGYWVAILQSFLLRRICIQTD